MFIIGIIVGERLALPSMLYVFFLVLLVAIGVLGNRHPKVSSICIHLATFVAGAWLVTQTRERVPKLDKGELRYEALIASQPIAAGKIYKCDLWIMGEGRPLKVKASLSRHCLPYQDTLMIGQGLVVTASLQPVLDIKNRGNKFDYKRWLRINQYDAVTFIWQRLEHRKIDISKLPAIEKLRIGATIFRSSLLQKYKQLGLEDRVLALVSAMTIGDKSLIDSKLRDDYSISGASHILALSGLHLAVLYTILSFIMTSIAKTLIVFTNGSGRILINFIKTLLLFVLIWGFAFIAGLTPSITRASAMISLYAIVDLTNRGHHPFNTLALTALIVLAYNPFLLWDISFQLSFMAVLGIFFFQPKRRLNYLLSLLWISLSAQMAVAPLLLYHFGRFSCYFLLTNIVVVPCANLILYCALVALLFFPFQFIQQVTSVSLSFCASLMDGWVQWVASLPGASIDNINFDVFQTISLYVLIICTYRIICLTLQSK